MSLTYTIPTKFIAQENFSVVLPHMKAQMSSFARDTNSFIAQQNNLFGKLSPNIGRATRNILNYAGAGSLLAGAAFSGKAIMDYETAIQSLSAVTGVSGDELEGFKAEIKSLGHETKKSVTDIAGSFEIIGSAMSQYLSDPKSLRQISEAGITLAKASRQELVPTLEDLTSIMNQFDLKANQATDTINRLTAGEIVGSLKTSDVAEALKEFGAGAFAANVTLSESVALTEALAKQLKSDKIGVGARNILTVLDSAKGLDKRAVSDLKSAGVDMGILMDRSKSLSERLHELSKISSDATKITSVFGKENKTAAQVLFNQLSTYDDYLAKIRVTNEANKQAETNSKTLAVSIEQLRNTWINYIATNDSSLAGLEKLKSGIGFIAENLDTIVSITFNAAKAFLVWQGVLVTARVVSTAYSVALGIQNAVQGLSIGLLEADVIAQRTSMIAKRANAIATGILTADMAALNAVMAANPVGALIVAVSALTIGLGYLYNREKQLREEYEKGIQQRRDSVWEDERIAVDKLTWSYEKLGLKKKDAFLTARRFEIASIDSEQSKINSQIEKDKSFIASNRFNPFREFGAANNQAKDRLVANSMKSTELSTRRSEIAKQLQAAAGSGLISNSEGAGLLDYGNRFKNMKNVGGLSVSEFRSKKLEEARINKLAEKEQAYMKEPISNNTQSPVMSERWIRAMEKIAAREEKNQNVNINITGLPAGATVTGTNVSSPSSY